MMRNRNTKNPPENAYLANTEEMLSLPADELISRFGTSTTGLTTEEATKRLETYGSNDVARRKQVSIIIEFLSHFKSPLVIILVIAAVVSGILGELVDSIIILTIVFMSVILDFTQEYRAGKAAEALRKRVATTATTFRDGTKQDIEISGLVPGDIIALSAGDIVPADARIINSKDFFVDQSALTGESFPVEKFTEPVAGAGVTDTGKWNNYVFMGTSVTNGTATAIITRTGSYTQYGEIARKSAEKKPETEFERGLRKFGFLIMQVTFILVIAVFFINAFFKRGVLESLLFAVALAVGLTPELLPMILSINLARGAAAMSKKGVIVKRLASIQNFGSMDVLCADKTGTLTENRVTVILHVDLEGNDSDKVYLYSLLNSRYQTGLRSPLDEAILKYKEVNIDPYQRIDEVPFDFVRKRLSVVVSKNQENFFITKGAPEEISKIVSHYELNGQILVLTGDIRGKIERQYRDLSSQGYRVLGVCYLKVTESKPTYAVADENNMVFLGFIAFMDPLKETAGESLELLRQAGVKLKVLTGDNEIVAGKICQQLGFQVYRYRRGRRFDATVGRMTRTVEAETMNIMRSNEIEEINDDALASVVERVDVFTRVTPAQKNRIMNALKANGHVVGFIGDGINDTPSMKVSDVSISVTNAVDIAKESADIILMQNDLKVISDGVAEGRKTFANTLKYVFTTTSANFGNMVSMAGASLLLPFLPLLPVQILLNNFLSDFPLMTIATDNTDPELVVQPRRWDTRFIRNFMIVFGLVSSLFDYLTFALLLFVFNMRNSPDLFRTAWFIESLLTEVFVTLVVRTRKPFFQSKPGRYLLISTIIVAVVAIIIPYLPFFSELLSFIPLPLWLMATLLGITLSYVIIVEVTKRYFYARNG
jgi:Mg2+-importing ATPase